MTAERRLTESELKALKIAAHRQLRRWNTREQRGEQHHPERRAALHRAVQWLDAYRPATAKADDTEPPDPERSG